LCSSKKRARIFVEVETNGTIQPSPTLLERVDQWNVSPKLASSGNAERARHRPATLAWFAARPNAQFKFVITERADVGDMVALARDLGIARESVLLTPEGVDTDTITARSRWLADECRTYGYRLGTRLHVFLWGSERGR
jgi:organic radical activating enzyme